MGTVDYWCNGFTLDRVPRWRAAIDDQGLSIKVRSTPDDAFCDPDDMVARMDELGIDTLVLPVTDPHDTGDPHDFSLVAALGPDEARALAAAHPGRFVGSWSYDPRSGQAGLRRAAEALDWPWVVALHLHTHSFDRAFDHAEHYAFYALAGERGLPVIMQAGTSGGLMASACGQPIGIDRPALYFPDVDFVLSHTGWPWVAEAVAMAIKHPNVYLGTAVYPQRHWDPAVHRFLRGPGRTKTLYATGFPATGHRHTLGQLAELDLPPETIEGYLGDNARRIMKRISPGPVRGR